MYGLMKAPICSRHQEAAHSYRLHYCGVCKTIGRLYGSKARFLLNYDAVFLAELLTALSPSVQDTPEWNPSYQSYNCFTLPPSVAEVPLSLQIAAAATLLMTEFKVADQIADGGSGGWKLAHKLLTSDFEMAATQLEAWNFPLDEIRRWGAIQDVRETAVRQYGATTPATTDTEITQTGKEVLVAVAEPTATVTGLVFQHSGTAVGCDVPTQERLYALGFAFGSLVYVLDALEDYAKDQRQGAFNALQVAFGLQEKELPVHFVAVAHAHLQELCQGVERELGALPLPPGQASQFVTRLRTNLHDRLEEEAEDEEAEEEARKAIRAEDAKASGSAPRLNGSIPREPAVSRACALPTLPPSLNAQGKLALAQARRLTTQYRQQHATPWIARFAAPGVFCTVLTIALLFPDPVRTATSYAECRDIACNLIFVGAALRRWTLSPLRWLPARAAFAYAGGMGAGVLLSSEETPSGSESLTQSSMKSSSLTVKKRKRRGPGCGSGCDSMDCDACCCVCEGADCCCDCGDCCSSCS